LDRTGKKTSAAIHQEITREVESLLRRVFAERRKSGGIDLEAVEMAIRSALHRAGAAGISDGYRVSVGSKHNTQNCEPSKW
jgi:hypothetical protein